MDALRRLPPTHLDASLASLALLVASLLLGVLRSLLPLPMSSTKQRAVLAFLSRVGVASLDEIVRMVPEVRTFHNSKKYLGETLSRMVKAGLVVRVGRGKYRIAQPTSDQSVSTSGS